MAGHSCAGSLEHPCDIELPSFAVLWSTFGAETSTEQGLFRSGWLFVGLPTQTLIVHMIRTPKVRVLEGLASAALAAMTLCITVP